MGFLILKTNLKTQLEFLVMKTESLNVSVATGIILNELKN